VIRLVVMMRPKVLFLCTGNSARSQMAEGYLRHVAADRFEAMSAGIAPKGLNPLAVEAMREIGIDISEQTSKDVVSLLGQHVPYVVTVCDNAKERCPIFPGTWKFLHWSLEDPAAAEGTPEERLAVFRSVRDQIIANIDREFVQGDLTRKRA
jgi:arsenate reductase